MSEAHSLERAEPAYAAHLARFGDHEWNTVREALDCVDSAASFGRWADPVQQVDGSWTMPYATLSAECSDFMRTLDRLGMHIPFDWMAWDHGRTLAESPERLDRATPAEAAMVIFALWRSDRFVEGELLAAFENGPVQRATRRVLAASSQRSG
jgi:hypothetical protein